LLRVLRGGTARAVARSEGSLYQSASNASKRQSATSAKTSKIRANFFFTLPRIAHAHRAPEARDRFLKRRTRMRFWETIGQHFRRTLVSRRFPSRERGRSHVMGTGAIATCEIRAVLDGELLRRAREYARHSMGTACSRALRL
jgi:hypothetical protein